jgi:hypothetical protein
MFSPGADCREYTPQYGRVNGGFPFHHEFSLKSDTLTSEFVSQITIVVFVGGDTPTKWAGSERVSFLYLLPYPSIIALLTHSPCFWLTLPCKEPHPRSLGFDLFDRPALHWQPRC